jgi:hypothetical protein
MNFWDYILEPVINRLNKMETKIMAALDDLTNAVNALTAEEAQFLTDIAGKLAGGSVSDAQAEALATVINQRAADMVSADPVPPAPPVVPPVS